VGEREIDAADRQVHGLVVRPVGIAVGRGPMEVFEAELAAVDDGVVEFWNR
jgi:hypothetical protein